MTKEQQEPKAKNTATIISLVAAAIIVGGLGFAGGIQYQKSRKSTLDTQAAVLGGRSTMMGQFEDGGPGGMRGGLGIVGAVSSSSITVKNVRISSETTYAITNSTTVLDGQKDAAVSDIVVGDTVMVQTNTSDTNTATSIVLNPTMGGPGGMMGQGGANGAYDTSQ